MRRYLWNETDIKESRLVFHGTGKEMFKGFIIAYLILGALYAGFFWSQSNPDYAFYFLIAFYIALIIIMPLAIFGAWSYRVTRTSWRGIYMGFDGNFKKFLGLYFQNIVLVIVTFGLYMPWFRVEIMKFLFGHTLIGKNRLGFVGNGGTLFGINIIGGILSVFTLYLYLPVYYKNLVNFTINNAIVDNGEKKMRFKSHLSGSEAWTTLVTNFLLIIFTLGIGFAWATIRQLRMILENIEIPSNLDFDNLEQADKGTIDATGDELVDILDIGLDF